jgi:transposase
LIQLPPKFPDLNPIENIWYSNQNRHILTDKKTSKEEGEHARVFVFITEILELTYVKKAIKKL